MLTWSHFSSARVNASSTPSAASSTSPVLSNSVAIRRGCSRAYQLSKDSGYLPSFTSCPASSVPVATMSTQVTSDSECRVRPKDLLDSLLRGRSGSPEVSQKRRSVTPARRPGHGCRGAISVVHRPARQLTSVAVGWIYLFGEWVPPPAVIRSRTACLPPPGDRRARTWRGAGNIPRSIGPIGVFATVRAHDRRRPPHE